MKKTKLGRVQLEVLSALREHESWTDYDGCWGPVGRSLMRDTLRTLERRGLVARAKDTEGCDVYRLADK